MKRFYNNTIMSGALSKALRVLALLCVLLGVSSSAWGVDYYVTGNAFNGWGNFAQLTKETDNRYTIAITKTGSFKMSNRDSYNDDFWKGIKGATDDAGFSFDNGANGNNGGDASIKITSGTLCFDPSGNNGGGWIWTEEASSDCDPSADIYLTGSFNSWNTAQANYKLTANPGNDAEVMIKGVTLSANAEFKVFQGCFYGYENLVQTDDNKGFVANTTDGNIKVTKAGTYDVYFDKNDHHIYIGLNVPCTEDDSNLGECDRIEVYCRYTENDDCNMKIYAYSSCTSKILNSNGTAGNSGEKVNVNGTNYAKWVFPTTGSNICVKFISGTNASYATTVRCNLSSGYKYYFTLPSGWGNQSFDPTSEKISCGGSSGDDDDDDTGDCKTLYLEPTTTHWNKEGARFAAYFYGGGPAETWVDMESSTCNGLFKVAVPNSAYTNVIFVRMNGATSENNWNNKWNQTNDLSLNHSNNLYTITNIGGGNQHSSGNWSTTSCDDKADCSGTGGDDEPDNCDYVEIWARGKGSYTDIYCNVTSATAQSTGIKSYNGNNYATWIVTTKTAIAVSFCAGNKHEYCTNTGSMEPGNRYYCEFAAEGWGSQDYTITLTEPLDCNEKQTAVLLSKQALVNKTAGKATLYGYLSSTNCDKKIVDYGFYYCRVIDGNKCKPTASSYKLQVSPSKELLRGEEFSAELEVEDGYTYYYRAYAKINDVDVLSAETRLISTDPCVQQVCCGEPVVYTINADPDFMENVCKLHFTSLQDAIDHLKNSASRTDAYQYVEKVGSSYNLKQPVVMNVVYYDDTPLDNTSAYIYRGTTNVGKRAGDAVPKNSNLIEDINRTATNAANTLTIKAGTSIAKPWIHHIVLRNSKNIVLDSLCIYSDPVLYEGKTIGDNALEMDINHADGSANWHELNTRTGEGIDAGQHFFSNANILVQNCMIGSDGFTGAHISSYDGVTFKNNDFEIVAGANMDKNYGASFKLLYCKNVKFIENNFRGDHATLMWIQEVNNMLVMNNVFWNTNKLVIDQEGDQYPAAMRLVTQFSNSIANVGFFYNTYYFAENNVTVAVPSGYDFLQMTHTVSGGSGDIDINTIKFQYNNCYSYDADAHGRTADNYNILNPGDRSKVIQTGPFLGYNLGSNSNFCPNNFWSQYDDDNDYSTSKFAFGCAQNEFTNVKGQVCETSASGPASLMIKGEDLNNGVKPDIAFTGITLTDEEWYSDRYLSAVRPKANEGWTYGAYQSKGEIITNTIYWVGTTDKWDDRNNWEYETRDASGKMIRQRVSCINTLSEDLKVVIEEIGTVEVAGGRKWPKVPASFDPNDRKTESGVPVGEQVSAGLGAIATPTKFASTIELGYGAGLRGVENLKEADGKTLRYDRAITHFDAPRDRWLLVGTVVKPFVDEKAGTTRNVISRDYYMDFLPQIYMHQTVVDGNTVSWTRTFPDLDKEVEPTTVFAINASNYYGKYYESAATYNKWNGTNYDGTAPIPYSFTGRFAVEEGATGNTPYAFTATANATNLLNNNYPCNIDALKIEELGLGTVNVYDYENASFVSTAAYKTSKETDKVFIKAQNGFVFIPKPGKTLALSNDILAEGSTRTRSVERELPTFSLNVDNANTTAPGASNVVIRYDNEQEAFFEAPLNTPKVFTKNADTPEAYAINNDNLYTRLYVGNGVTRIPLGIRLLKDMNVTFQKVYSEGFSSMILLDAETGKEYNLLARDYTTEKLAKGDTEGRFYLLFTLEEQDDNQDDDFTTDIEDALTEQASINIYAVGSSTVRVLGNNTELQTIYVSDMAGRTMRYDASGNFAELQLPVSQGVYLVQVIGDNATRTEKVILK